ncbi:hypothetical protein DSO57_1029072 [Entomophthora muscae]|uniref:Uncharacterized protein n=1 Tax=Entomophthora muscae TaxID=34485 RepID=A0ACC2SQ95_9FUNG|nr:hypothetical protein DSO57_1029072 [Entomophthora muscae]
MELLITPKPMPMFPPKLPTDHSNKLFGIMYITLSGVIDTIIPLLARGPGLGISSYLVVGSVYKKSGPRDPGNDRMAAQAWIPDILRCYAEPNIFEPRSNKPVKKTHNSASTFSKSTSTALKCVKKARKAKTSPPPPHPPPLFI